MSGTVLYTAILGGSDSLKRAPRGYRSICFTDGTDLGDGRGWELRAMAPGPEPRREAWRCRCRSHLVADGPTVWADASFRVVDLPALLREARGLGADLVGFRHPERESCYAEGSELVRIGQALAADVDAQLDGYRREGFQPASLTTAGLLYRRLSPAVHHFNALWEGEIQNHPGDNTQLSLDYCAWRAGLQVAYLEGTYPSNPYVRYDADDHHARRRPYR